MDAPAYYATTIFCDDIRPEAGSKFSLMGVYGGKLVAEDSFPLTMPKFGFSITYVQRQDVYLPEASIRIYLPGDEDGKPSITGEISDGAERQEARIKEAAANPVAPGEVAYIAMGANLLFAPLTLKEAGLIKVRLIRAGEEVKAGRLQVRSAPPAAT
jgi:hypothetical protein